MIRYILSIGLSLICLALPAQRVSVLGDSYSTFEDYITPLTNEVWYYAKSDTSRTDVVNVRDTWWWQFVKDNGLQLCVNNSYASQVADVVMKNEQNGAHPINLGD